MCVIDTDEHPDLWIESEHKARTAKVCRCCHGPIAVGDRYIKHFSKYDGGVYSEVMCLPCDKDRNEFGAAHEAIPMPSMFRSMLRECVDESDDSDRWSQMLAGLNARKAATVPGLVGRLSLGRV